LYLQRSLCACLFAGCGFLCAGDALAFCCGKKMIAARFISDGKDRPIVRYPGTPDGTIEERNTLVPYNNVLEFLQKNPDCCTVIPDEEIYVDYEPITFWDRFCGGYSYGVVVK